jgi:hypothetical protein
MLKLRKAYIKNCVQKNPAGTITPEDIRFLAEDTQTDAAFVRQCLKDLEVSAS